MSHFTAVNMFTVLCSGYMVKGAQNNTKDSLDEAMQPSSKYTML